MAIELSKKHQNTIRIISFYPSSNGTQYGVYHTVDDIISIQLVSFIQYGNTEHVDATS